MSEDETSPPARAARSGAVASQPTRFVLITGLSGSGKSSVAKCFEDLGYLCVDNLPLSLLRPFLDRPQDHAPGVERIAIVTDIRTPGLASELPEILAGIDRSKLDLVLLFMETSEEVLVRRYSETRRRHPLDSGGPVIEDIRREREMLGDIRGLADKVYDTTEWTIHEVRAEIYREFSTSAAELGLTLSLVSFGFKRGIPYGTDMLFDVRFLPNPYFVPELRPLSGLDRPIVDYLEELDEFAELRERLSGLLEYLLPRFSAENRSYLTVSIGCTGGRHRSVALTEALAGKLRGAGWLVRVQHRDIDR